MVAWTFERPATSSSSPNADSVVIGTTRRVRLPGRECLVGVAGGADENVGVDDDQAGGHKRLRGFSWGNGWHGLSLRPRE